MKNYSNCADFIQRYASDLEARITFLEKKQKTLPAGYIKYVRRGDKVQYYLRRENHQLEYISSKNQSKISSLVNAHYVRRVLPKLKKNYRAAKKFLELHSGLEEFQIAEALPIAMQQLNGNLFACRAAEVEAWQSKPYERNPRYMEHLIYESQRGEMMRSKSEVFIANRILAYKLPYKPECPLFIESIEKTWYPDFMLLNPRTLEVVIWEHFGLMSDPDYAKAACQKIKIYRDNGFVIGKNLIVTFEADGVPLTIKEIDKCIEEVFGECVDE